MLSNRGFYRLFAGKANLHLSHCISNGYIGLDIESNGSIEQMLSGISKDIIIRELVKNYMLFHPKGNKMQAGKAAHTCYRFFNQLQLGDVVLSPRGNKFVVGYVKSGYKYDSSLPLAHYREVDWTGEYILKSCLPSAVLNSAGAINVFCDLSRFSRAIQGCVSKK